MVCSHWSGGGSDGTQVRQCCQGQKGPETTRWDGRRGQGRSRKGWRKQERGMRESKSRGEGEDEAE